MTHLKTRFNQKRKSLWVAGSKRQLNPTINDARKANDRKTMAVR